MKYFAKIKYLGDNFCGFQVQPDKRTVQGELCNALNNFFGSPTKVTGCSRTDSGVHANEFCLTLENDDATVPADKLPIALIPFLPEDLSLFYAESASEDFHPRYEVKSKEYLYRIYNSKVPDPFYNKRAWFLPRIITDEGLTRMKMGAKELLGKNDFRAFMAEGSDVSSTVREMFYIKIDKINDNIIEIRLSADGFLYNMVRIIVGTLTEVALGRFEPEQVKDILLSKNRKNAGLTAPADGLYLNKVVY
jgi:tRNA pseudouridine38-40 synthase